jgi:hypothetical protein
MPIFYIPPLGCKQIVTYWRFIMNKIYLFLMSVIISNFSYAADPLSASVTKLAVKTTTRTAFNVLGGTAPYNVSANKGSVILVTGNLYQYVSPTDNLAASGVIKIEDATKSVISIPVTIEPSLSVPARSVAMPINYVYTIKPTNGFTPFRYTLQKGVGSLSGAVYTAPSIAGTAQILVQDASNNSVTVDIAVINLAANVKNCINPLTKAVIASGNTYTYFTASSGSSAQCIAAQKVSTCQSTGVFSPVIPSPFYASCTVVAPPQITSFVSSMSRFVAGQPVVLSWTTLGATSLQLNPGAINVAGKTSYTVTPTSSTQYTLTATNIAGNVSKTVMLSTGQFLAGDYIREPYAEGCVPQPNTDYMNKVDWAMRIEPRDCAKVLVGNPVFSWSLPSDLVANGYMNFTLKRVSDSVIIHSVSTQVPRLLLPPAKALAAGLYSWTVDYVNKSNVKVISQVRRLGIPTSRQFIIPSGDQVASIVLQKSHPRILPAGSSFESIISLAQNSEYKAAFNKFLLNANTLNVAGVLAEPAMLPAGSTPTQTSQWASAVRSAVMRETSTIQTLSIAYYFNNNISYKNLAIAKLVNMASWSINGSTSEVNQDQANREVYMALASGLDLYYSSMSANQKTVIVNAIKARLATIMTKFSNFNRSPFDSHLITASRYVFETLMYIAGTPGLEAETAKLASTWELLMTTSGPYGGGTDGAFGNGTAYGWYNLTTLAPNVAAIKLVTGINITKFPAIGNVGLNEIAFTPPNAKLLGQFGDEIEVNNHYNDYSYNEFRLLANVSGKPEYEWYWRARPENLANAYILPAKHFLMLGASTPVIPPATTVIPKSFLFEEAGYTAMHSDATKADRSSVFFRSSYLGSVNHSHADNNSFNFVSKGKEMFISGGYYPAYASAHHLNIGRATRFKNALTFNGGIGQSEPVANPTVPGAPVFSEDPSGKLINFIDNGKWAVTTGDATLAYRGLISKAGAGTWNSLLSNAIRSVAYNRTEGIVIVYDWATSTIAKKWELNFQTLFAPSITQSTKAFQIVNAGVTACVDYYGPGGKLSVNKNFPIAPELARPDQYQTRLTVDTPSIEFVGITIIRENCSAPLPAVNFVSGPQSFVTINGDAIGFNKKLVQFNQK